MTVVATDRRVQIIKALAHPARLEIAQALAAGPRCVSDLQALVGSDISTVSKHLALMRKAGWISCRKDGLHIFYRLACPCLNEFLQCVDSLGAEGSCNSPDC